MNEVVKWINAKNHNIKLQFSLSFGTVIINFEDYYYFLNSNRIICISPGDLSLNLPENFYLKVKEIGSSLILNFDKF